VAGIFVGVHLTPAAKQQIRAYVKSLNLPANCRPVPDHELHVTLIYSPLPLPVDFPLDKQARAPARAFALRYIGDALAIILESKWLRWRYRLAKLCGYRTPYAGYIPHLSICYDPPKNLPIAFWPKPDFRLQLGGEYSEPLKDKK